MGGKHSQPEPSRQRREFAELPPRPDPYTGEPTPPHAPKYKNTDVSPEKDPTRDVRLSRKPQPPPGMGPVLVWHRDSVTGQIFGYLVALAIMVVGVAILSLLRDFALHAFEYWQLWLIIVVFAYLMSNPFNVATVSAGADWVQMATRKRWYQRRARSNYLKLYELVKVEGEIAGASWYLYLEDVDGRAMDRPPHEFQPDRKTWDLVYNGILHSVANGAQTNTIAESMLELDDTPALRLRDDADQ